MTIRVEDLRRRVAEAEKELQVLRRELAEAESRDHRQEQHTVSPSSSSWKWPLSASEYERYGRQLIVPTVGLKGQLRLKASSVLVVGAGGLGCPAAAYIAGAGVGVLGLIDGDEVEASNLHRQVAHTTSRVGTAKVDSAIAYLRDLNPELTYHAHKTHLTPQNAESVVRPYDLVLDCTDHPTSRYLISDICVLLRKPLVSASAFKTDGQLIVLNNPPAPQGAVELSGPGPGPNSAPGGPCYRCLFPRPPPPDSVVSCGEGGILGPIVGVMGVLQALEAIKLVAAGGVANRDAITASPPSSPTSSSPPAPSLLLFSGTSSPPFRSVRVRGRRKDCFACGADSALTLESLRSGSLDYVAFCGVAGPLEVLEPEERVSAAEFQGLYGGGGGGGCSGGEKIAGEGEGEKGAESEEGRGVSKKAKAVLLDVREREHFDLCSIEGAVNVPIATFLKGNQVSKNTNAGGADGEAGALAGEEPPSHPAWWPRDVPDDAPVYVVCRVGKDSQLAAKRLKDMGLDLGGMRFIGDIKGGMRAWKDEVDPTLPFA